MGTRNDWTHDEQLAICLAWALMADAVEHGVKFNKSAIRRELIGSDDSPGPLHNRSHGSIEAKLMNCSAAAQAVGYSALPGYKPAPNYQQSLRGYILQAMDLVRSERRAVGEDAVIEMAACYA